MRRLLCVLCLWSLVLAALRAQQRDDMLARIRTEGLQRSSALALYRTLTDDIGARLTGSPAHVKAARWANDRFTEWKLTNPHLEPWDFGRGGWQVDKLSVEMTEPRYMPLIAYPDAWSPQTAGVVSGRVVYVGDKTTAQVQAMGAQLRGAIVLTHLPVTEWVTRDRPQPGLSDAPTATGNPPLPQPKSTAPASELMPLLRTLGAAAALRPSAYRDNTVGVTGARNIAPDAVPMFVVAGEQYNVLARLAAAGHPPSLRVELRTRTNDDRNSYNVIAEIPGGDPALRDQIVLVGGHLDSWHTANGATDNADGAVAVMEAIRILKAIGAQPRRTIRVALWSGEEQGLLGSRAYLAQHLATPADRRKLFVYLNDDPGSGRTLGFYMEKNQTAKAVFDRWLAPLRDLGATRNVIEPINATDHVPFQEAGMPGFNVIKEFAAYDERTRHTNADYSERMSEDALKQSAIFLATFAWQAANSNDRLTQ